MITIRDEQTIDFIRAIKKIRYRANLSDEDVVRHAVKKYYHAKKELNILATTVKGIRRALWREQDHRCFYCKRVLLFTETTLDHKRPMALGGSVTERANLVVACLPCNGEKSELTAEEYIEYRNEKYKKADPPQNTPKAWWQRFVPKGGQEEDKPRLDPA